MERPNLKKLFVRGLLLPGFFHVNFLSNQCKADPCVQALCSMAVATEVGDGTNTLFWTDRWILGQRIEDLCPLIHGMVPKRIANKRTVSEAMNTMIWIRDIHGMASLQVIEEFLQLWDIISQINLQPNVSDRHIWRLSATGQYTAQSAYEALFQGAVQFDPWRRIWKTWVAGKCRFFLWLAAHKHCWTADRLAKRQLPHPPSCPLCDQDNETIDHLLVGCVFARQFWFVTLQRVGLADLSPQNSDTVFDGWWSRIASLVTSAAQKGLNSLIALGAWTLWRHRNNCVFNGATPSLAAALSLAWEDAWLWSRAGAKALSQLTGNVAEEGV